MNFFIKVNNVRINILYIIKYDIFQVESKWKLIIFLAGGVKNEEFVFESLEKAKRKLNEIDDKILILSYRK